VVGGLDNRSSVKRYDAATDWRNAIRFTIGSVGPTEEQDLFDSLIHNASRRQP
jgi:hypothetical protein